MFKLSNYYKPTPARWRKIGDGLLAASTFVTGYSLIANYHTLAITALVVGAIGKFMTDFFHESDS
jgi:hypothetical protein